MTLIDPSLGLPNRDLEPHAPRPPPPPKPTTTPETDTIPRSPISTLPDFTIAGTPDDESTRDPTAITLRDTSILTTGTLKCCGVAHCSASMPVPCHSTLLCSVRCSQNRTLRPRDRPTVVPAFCPRTWPQTLPHSSGLYISHGRSSCSYTNGSFF